MMNALVPIINAQVVGLSHVLGKSPEAVASDCTIRELLLYLAMLPDPPPKEQDGQPSTPEHTEPTSVQ